MRVVCAGAGQKDYRAAVDQYNCSKLYSFLNEPGYIKKWPHDRWLMIDSGAHSWNKFTITKIGHASEGNLPEIGPYLQKYAAFMKEFATRPWVWVEFDIYGHLGLEEIDKQYAWFTSIVGKDKFIRVYHPIIDGGSLVVLDKWIAEGQKYIGVGNDSTPYLDQIFSRTRDKVKIHGFAMTKFDLVQKYPFYSVDSTSPLATVMYGTVAGFGLKNIPKKALIKKKDPRYFNEATANLWDSVKKLKETENYLTALWKKRRVVWHE